MKIALPLITFIAGIVLCVVVVAVRLDSLNARRSEQELAGELEHVQKKLSDTKGDIEERLQRFARRVHADRDFAMKLFVEKDPSAFEITEMARHYLEPMGFDLLTIVDSAYRILSSGHFPASVGGRIAAKGERVRKAAGFIMDNVKGHEVLTLQAKASFDIQGAPFYCIGGIIVNKHFMAELSPRNAAPAMLKLNDTVIGPLAIESMSEIQDGSIIVNNAAKRAASFSVGVLGSEANAHLMVIMEPDSRLSVTSFLM
ncbi:MAG: hypothetical protein GF398_14255 [Chitinivibrionales bacterium]|nr:hypothetical protein [Chitinivibrionales bacterium]